MYKQFALDDLTTIQTNFFGHLQKLITKHNHQYFKSFLDATLKDAERVYFFEGSRPSFRLQRTEGEYRLIDEKERIEICTDQEGINRLHNMLRDTGMLRGLEKNQGILETLVEELQQGKHTLIAGKPYVVYDVETTFAAGGGITDQHFEMAYSISTADDNTETLQYRYVDRDNMRAYADYLLGFDGWVIGYNSFAFDNPVLVNNVGYGPEELRKLNEKSLDPFLLLWKLTGRRLGLDAVATGLISLGKSLSSGKEGMQLLEEYKKTGKKHLLNKVKAYCKNDVHMTLGVILYLLSYQSISLDGKQYEVSEEVFLRYGRRPDKEKKATTQTPSGGREF